MFDSAVSKEMNSAPRTGFFHNFKAKEVYIKKWDAYNEGNRKSMNKNSNVCTVDVKLLL